MMLTKEECLKSLCRIQCGVRRDKKCEDCECFDNKVNIWKCVENTQESIVLRKLIEEYFDPQPYKFEELHEGMWVWDNRIKEFSRVKKILTKEDCRYLYHDENKKVFMDEYSVIEFEEGRFFPVTKAYREGSER